MSRYRFYVGTLDANGDEVKHDKVQRYLMGRFSGYTAFPADGAWRDGGNHVVHEASVVYEILEDAPLATGATMRGHADALRSRARQRCVLYTAERVLGGFVHGT